MPDYQPVLVETTYEHHKSGICVLSPLGRRVDKPSDSSQPFFAAKNTKKTSKSVNYCINQGKIIFESFIFLNLYLKIQFDTIYVT